ncbi:hypothetical protein [Paenimyroides baculatum]|uniref:Uncharacterized protein n=1 Tax=Paenimyroides baculatum TaxID=2608000 RepID=A0A5M6CH18_9FLAO|nr:hypothetical protein [Paenimyroides baculatum]KAA5534327.1 hypothetical protein F0460_09470 [Paenimyroides baculatum]
MKKYTDKEKIKFEIYGEELNEYIEFTYGYSTFGKMIDAMIAQRVDKIEPILIDNRIEAPHLIDRKGLADMFGTSTENIIKWQKNKTIENVYVADTNKVYYNFKNSIEAIKNMSNIKSKYLDNLKMNLQKYIL